MVLPAMCPGLEGNVMPRGDIEAKIASFLSWHYEFDLGGHRTPIAASQPPEV